MDLGLAGETVLITGGSGGIGRGLVLEFAREGANVVSADIDDGSHLVQAAADEGLRGSVLPLRADITDRASVERLVDTIGQRLGPVDVLVNNAGGGLKMLPVEDLDLETCRWNSVINIDGVINCTLAAGRHMLDRGRGSIINISSIGSLSGVAAQTNAHYAGTKGFVNSFARAVAVEWAGRGVRVNTIAPGVIVPHSSEHLRGAGSWWNRLSSSVGRPEDYAEGNEATISKMSGSLINRVGRPEDIAYLALFLASRVSSYITGEIISVSGGGYMP
jgi:NAD(P)-dependent dehydrogenase (short-subunit alcohol dehydrogenase family)